MSDNNDLSKWYVARWILFVIGFGLLITFIGYVLAPISKRVERNVLINSHQYIEGMQDRANVLMASLAEINSRLMTEVDEGIINGLKAQRATINVQLNAIRR